MARVVFERLDPDKPLPDHLAQYVDTEPDLGASTSTGPHDCRAQPGDGARLVTPPPRAEGPGPLTSRPADPRPRVAARALAAARWVRRRWVPLLVAAVLVRLLEACFPWQGYTLSFDARTIDFLAQEQAVERCLDRSGVTRVTTQDSLPPTYDLRAGLGEAEDLAACLQPLGPGVQLKPS